MYGKGGRVVFVHHQRQSEVAVCLNIAAATAALSLARILEEMAALPLVDSGRALTDARRGACVDDELMLCAPERASTGVMQPAVVAVEREEALSDLPVGRDAAAAATRVAIGAAARAGGWATESNERERRG